MLSKKAKRFLSRPLLVVPVICLFAACRGVEAKKVQEPSPSLELQLEVAKRALSLKEEDNASLTRQLEAAKQARQMEQEELKRQLDEARALFDERIATLSRQLSSATGAGRSEKDRLRELRTTLAESEQQRAAAVRELQDVNQFLVAKEREAADLAKQLEAAKGMLPAKPAKEPQYTKTQEPTRTVTGRQPILDKLSGIAPWVWIASAVVIVMLLYLIIRQSIFSKDR